MKSFYTLLFVYFIFSTLYSQNKTTVTHNVKGGVIDLETMLPLEFATVTFKAKKEGLKPIGTITDKQGNFKISIPRGIYDITFDFLSYKQFLITDITITKDLQLDPVHLTIASENLNEILVDGSSKPVSIKLDRMIYYIDKDLTIAGGSALSALNSIPNVSVNSEGKVSLRNDPNVKILINGKQSTQSNSDILNNINVNNIDKVEVITVPSSRYTASGTAGIINIIIKKGKNSGINASFNLTAGTPEYYGFSTNINYKKEKFNLYNNTGYLQRKSPGNSFIHSDFISNNTITASLNEDRIYERDKAVFNSLLGFDFEINPTSNFNASATINLVDGDDLNTNHSNYLEASKTLIQTFEKFDHSKINTDLFELSFSYDKKFKKEGHQINFYYIYENELDHINSKFTNYDIYPTNYHNISKDLNISSKKSIYNQLFGFDYSLPFGKNSLLETGYEGYIGDLTTDYNYNSYNSTSNTFINNINFSNVFKYDDIVHSFYTKLESSYKKLSYSAGLRIENADVNFNLENSPVLYNHKKTDYFPSTHFSYNFSENNNLTFSYGKRIIRQHYWYLNPFGTKISETNIVIGNPELEPFFSHLYELKHVKSGEKFTLSSSIYIKEYTNAPERITYSTGELINGFPVEITTYKNIASLHQLGFEQFANFTPYKWWNLSGGFNIYNSKQKGVFNYFDYNNIAKTIDFSSTDLSGYLSLSTKFTILKDWQFQTNYKYFAPSEGAISKRKEYQYVDAALSKNMFNNKATLTISVSDVFNSNRIERNINTASTLTHNMIQWNERMFILNFTYRFSQNDKNNNFEVDKDKAIMF
ncbi:MAG: outer membrane beta-barrel family protein [Flavobacteriaceae bacterium]|nr:outer membrane beta-barrel family protein [Flavobacteriaceae bacterium]